MEYVGFEDFFSSQVALHAGTHSWRMPVSVQDVAEYDGFAAGGSARQQATMQPRIAASVMRFMGPPGGVEEEGPGGLLPRVPQKSKASRVPKPWIQPLPS